MPELTSAVPVTLAGHDYTIVVDEIDRSSAWRASCRSSGVTALGMAG